MISNPFSATGILALAGVILLWPCESRANGHSGNQKIGAGYALWVPMMNISPASGSEREVNAMLAGNAAAELVAADALYGPMAEQFLRGRHRFERWRHFVGGAAALGDPKRLPLELHAPRAFLAFDFGRDIPEIVRIIVSLQFLAAAGDTGAGFARWKGQASEHLTAGTDQDRRMELDRRIDYLLLYCRDAPAPAVDLRFLVDAFHSQPLIAGAAACQLPNAPPPARRSNEERDSLGRALARRVHSAIVSGYLSRRPGPKASIDIQGIFADLRRLDEISTVGYPAVSDSLVAVFLAFADDDLWSTRGAEIRDGIRALGAARRKLWIPSEGRRIDRSRIPAGARLVDGNDPARHIEVIDRTLF